MPRVVIKSDVYPQWSKAKYWAFVRSGLRRLWSRWPIKYVVKKNARRKNQSDNARLKWEFQCNKCKKWFPDKFVTVDHIIQCGTLREYSDLPQFVKTLLCGAENLQVLCDDCHSLKTKKERADKNK